MLSFVELDKIWAKALREHALTPLLGEKGLYRAIGDKSLRFLDELWKARRAPLPDFGAMIEAGKVVRFWSDPHFFHENILRMTQRVEFRDIDDMNDSIWANVEQAAANSDMVVCLGDLAMKNPLSVQRRLVTTLGDKQFTIVGNHDVKGGRPEAWAASAATSSLAFSLPRYLVQFWLEADHGEMADLIDWKRLPSHINFGLSHWPVPPDRLPGPAWLNLHGHIHNRPTGPLRLNCSVEAIGYVPKTLRELVTVELIDDLVRRQRGLDAIMEPSEKNPGDAEYLATRTI